MKNSTSSNTTQSQYDGSTTALGKSVTSPGAPSLPGGALLGNLTSSAETSKGPSGAIGSNRHGVTSSHGVRASSRDKLPGITL